VRHKARSQLNQIDPPAVITGEGELHCAIDTRSNRHQRLVIS